MVKGNFLSNNFVILV